MYRKCEYNDIVVRLSDMTFIANDTTRERLDYEAWLAQGNTPEPPLPPEAPRSVSPLQMRRALRQSGMRAAVEAYVETLDEDGRDAWQYATEIPRDNAIIAAGAKALGLSEAQIDDLFVLAATL